MNTKVEEDSSTVLLLPLEEGVGASSSSIVASIPIEKLEMMLSAA